jgi:DNA-directed RNA polymerase specialized sigma24 family protein
MNSNNTPRSDSSSAPPASHFPATRPSLVQQAAHGDAETAARAIRELCVLYRAPLRHWLARHLPQVRDHDDAAQGFVEFLLEQNRFRSYQPGAAKFRSFLIKCLKWYLRGEHRKAEAEKRGGGTEPVNLDDVEVGQVAETDQQLDRELALAIHRRVMSRLAKERYGAESKQARLQGLRPFLFGDTAGASQTEVATRLSMSVGAVSKALFDLRDAYFEFLRDEVMQITTPENLADEMRYLGTLLAQVEAPDFP